jgi:drug/metabolite transporter (DMT)-like permease
VPPRHRLLPLLALGTTLVLWASAFVGIRFLAPHFDPGTLTLGRLVVGSLALGLTLLASANWVSPTPREWAGMTLIGVLWFGVYNLSLNAAERLIDAGTAAMLVQISPILIALLSALFLKERVHIWLVIGMAVAFAGVVLIGTSGSGTGHSNLLGAGLCVVAALTYSISLVIQKPLVGRLSALQVTWVACTVGVLASAPFAASLAHDLSAAPVSAIAWLVYLGVFPTAIAFTAYAYALKYVPASGLGVSTYLVPPITALISLVALHEVPPAITWIGGALCLAGVALTRRVAATPTAQQTPRD